MTDKEVIIDDVELENIKNLLFTGQKMVISTKTFAAIIEQLDCYKQALEKIRQYTHITLPLTFERKVILTIINEVLNDE